MLNRKMRLNNTFDKYINSDTVGKYTNSVPVGKWLH